MDTTQNDGFSAEIIRVAARLQRASELPASPDALQMLRDEVRSLTELLLPQP